MLVIECALIALETRTRHGQQKKEQKDEQLY